MVQLFVAHRVLRCTPGMKYRVTKLAFVGLEGYRIHEMAFFIRMQLEIESVINLSDDSRYYTHAIFESVYNVFKWTF